MSDNTANATKFDQPLSSLHWRKCTVGIAVMETVIADVGCLEPLAPAVVTQGGEVVEATPTSPPVEPEFQQRLNQDAHRRWRANTSVEFLNKVSNIDIPDTRTEDRTVLYVLENGALRSSRGYVKASKAP
ncbi:uncharacterized protein PITG_08140 [Phytophthora infestans T30-4]|uniref:Uncharacterized protein n=1 Tax=Phytophthora infestans (strain T30-4) TaxID=403677 RepID=D0N9J9_PHYIT|nr:uncharacterized protein PITG_08140 [Phytophthora infestans T30-4]EEY54487.1 hypothetical protein PITG_08140 [Phytophthora infestans T30-4]|eukprot:XP_002904309.1 hypothetical protein PITG_08140 [Phytophthora infestans T30-4]